MYISSKSGDGLRGVGRGRDVDEEGIGPSASKLSVGSSMSSSLMGPVSCDSVQSLGPACASG